MPDALNYLNIDADFEVDLYITRKHATTRAIEAATGLTGVSARFAASPSGATLGTSTVALTEAGTTGRYVGVIDTTVMVTDLAASENRTVYLVGSKSGDFDRVFAEYVVRRKQPM